MTQGGKRRKATEMKVQGKKAGEEGEKKLEVEGFSSKSSDPCFFFDECQVQPGGKVVGLERLPDLVAWGQGNIEKANPELLESGVVQIVQGDGVLKFCLPPISTLPPLLATPRHYLLLSPLLTF